jgi:fatty acid desaturase
MDEFTRQAIGEWEAKRSSRRRVVALHAIVWAAVNLLLFVVWAITGAGFPWFVFPLFGWLVGLAAHAGTVYVLRDPDDVVLAREAARRRQLDR